MVESLSNQSTPERIEPGESVGQEFKGEGMSDKDVVDFVIGQRRSIRDLRKSQEDIWKECWELYRGKQDFTDKEEWQSKVVLPKTHATVKQATNAISRLLREADQPWTLEPINKQDEAAGVRASRISELLKMEMDEAHSARVIAECLETGFIQNHGVIRIDWSLRKKIEPPRPHRDPVTGQSRVVRNTKLVGGLNLRAVDPFNFYWLPGSRFNDWVGTIEDIQAPVYEVKEYAKKLNQSRPDHEKINVDKITARRLQQQQYSEIRHDQTANGTTDRGGLATCILTEYFGPLIDKNHNLVAENAHVLIVNDEIVLFRQANQRWQSKPPYVAFSPLLIPFRESGVGLVEPVRDVNKSLNQLINLSQDKNLMSLLPMFETIASLYENPEELDNGVVPGKILKLDMTEMMSAPPGSGIKPIVTATPDVYTRDLEAILDRAHQEGAFMGEIAQFLPRVRGHQTLGEVQIKDANQNSFLSALARDIDESLIEPIVEMSRDLMLQYMDTIIDERVAMILGIENLDAFFGMSQVDLLQEVDCNCTLKVNGVSSQVDKMQTLESLVQLMNILTQGAEHWLPLVNMRELFKRIIHSFPQIDKVDELLNPPEVEQSIRQQQAMQALQPEILRAVGGLAAAASAPEPDQGGGSNE